MNHSDDRPFQPGRTQASNDSGTDLSPEDAALLADDSPLGAPQEASGPSYNADDLALLADDSPLGAPQETPDPSYTADDLALLADDSALPSEPAGSPGPQQGGTPVAAGSAAPSPDSNDAPGLSPQELERLADLLWERQEQARAREREALVREVEERWREIWSVERTRLMDDMATRSGDAPAGADVARRIEKLEQSSKQLFSKIANHLKKIKKHQAAQDGEIGRLKAGRKTDS